MRIVLTGGCTGGHIYPALAIGDKFKEMDPANEVIYIGHDGGLETSIVPKAGYELKTVDADWFRRDNPVTLAKTLAVSNRGAMQARKIMRDFKPDVVVSTGSFVSVPVVLAAIREGIPFYLHEQNGYPGVSNRSFAMSATRVFLGFGSAAEYFRDKAKLIYSGNPVRKDFNGRDRSADRKELGISDTDVVITVFGGSLGSETTNRIGLSLIKEYGGREGYTILFGTGKDYYENVTVDIKRLGYKDYDNIRVMPYISNMPQLMSASDLVVSRAGALSVAEVTMAGVAAVFVPSPNVTADHQYYNAKAVADKGGAVLVRESDNTSAEVMEHIKELTDNPEKIKEMAAASAALAPTEAANIIYENIMATYQEGNGKRAGIRTRRK